MTKKNKRFTLILFFLLFISNFCLAFELEINYPQLSTGEQLTAQSTIPQYAKYLFNWGMTIGFLSAVVSLIIAGALYILSVANPGAKAIAMDRVYGTITGLILLLLVYLIVTTINPELSIFKAVEPKPIVPSVATPVAQDGVFLFGERDCASATSSTTSAPTTSPTILSSDVFTTVSLPDLGNWKNKIQSISVVSGRSTAYFAILHDIINFRGKCEYFASPTPCETIKPYAASISTYRYNYQNPTGNGVTFYRKPFYDTDGGWLNIKNDEIKNKKIYVGTLKNLIFNGDSGACNVPEKERNCTEWDFNGSCKKREECPNLAEENINSIKIDGDYIVVLIYWNGGSDNIWPSCQVFPSLDDKNKEGSRQIKWEYIRNQFALPNYVLIFPIVR